MNTSINYDLVYNQITIIYTNVTHLIKSNILECVQSYNGIALNVSASEFSKCLSIKKGISAPDLNN